MAKITTRIETNTPKYVNPCSLLIETKSVRFFFFHPKRFNFMAFFETITTKLNLWKAQDNKSLVLFFSTMRVEQTFSENGNMVLLTSLWQAFELQRYRGRWRLHIPHSAGTSASPRIGTKERKRRKCCSVCRFTYTFEWGFGVFNDAFGFFSSERNDSATSV